MQTNTKELDEVIESFEHDYIEDPEGFVAETERGFVEQDIVYMLTEKYDIHDLARGLVRMKRPLR